MHRIFAYVCDASKFCTQNVQESTVQHIYAKILGKSHEQNTKNAVLSADRVQQAEAYQPYAKFLCSFGTRMVYMQNLLSTSG